MSTTQWNKHNALANDVILRSSMHRALATVSKKEKKRRQDK